MKKLIIISALLCGTAHAEFKSGNELYAHLKGSHGEQMMALGYIIGVTDALRGVTVCPPAELTAGQAVDMTAKYLENYPALRHFTGDAIVNRVLSSIWPCANKKGSSL